MLATTRNLVDQVKFQISESNDTRVSPNQILAALNRGYVDAQDILSKLYPEPLISFYEVNADENGTITLREDIFSDFVILVEYYLQDSANGYRTKITQSDNLNDIGIHNNITGGYPYVYSIIGRDLQFAPAKSASKYRMRIWYVNAPKPLVLDQGQIETIDRDNNYIVVDDLRNSDVELSLSASSSYGKFVNFVDASTGVYKGTMQIDSISGNKITFKSTPTRTSVLNQTVLSEIPEDLSLDDFISSVKGVGVVYFRDTIANYIVQYAINEIQRSLGVSNLSFEEGVLRDLRKRVEQAWERRPASRFKRSFGRVWRSKNYRNWTF